MKTEKGRKRLPLGRRLFHEKFLSLSLFCQVSGLIGEARVAPFAIHPRAPRNSFLGSVILMSIVRVRGTMKRFDNETEELSSFF